ncbi:hypothetical protein GGTG_07127 [Gaeumannomyces tritici R3-111a-1]|uniref:Uncharacterized protein n=1 Tax=Gaeumannomyces tritici (strain R3-111a-1) TaxID=644352 RepID=J3P0T2_GAET3|nr:hypothetical protein GGTG_07127 [Gaeumannomyces tritici R3-111a-1]EJT77215.1 hypothetical protein GGTG_07127 [Gaeumannomyces tritici R3-111a-1]
MLMALASPAIRNLPNNTKKALIKSGTIQEMMVEAMVEGGHRRCLAKRIMASKMERIGGIAFSVGTQ